MAYKVTDTRQIQSVTPAGTPRQQYRVWITTDHGASGSIDVSGEDWEAERLREILTEFADRLDLAYTIAAE